MSNVIRNAIIEYERQRWLNPRSANPSTPRTENNREGRFSLNHNACHALSRFGRAKEAIAIADRLFSISQEEPSSERAFDYEIKAYIRLVEAHGCAGDIASHLHAAKEACSLLDKYSESFILRHKKVRNYSNTNSP